MENEEKDKDVKTEKLTPASKPEHPSHLQVYDIITSRDPSWQGIIYELIASEQIDPWNIDIATLCRAYFEKIKELEQNNFHISSKLLLVAALLLRIKSEILLNRYVRDIDNILFKREEEDLRKIIERIEIDENEIPVLSPRTPLPRFKKVTLQELISALDVAINTESRRINKEIALRQAKRLSYVDIPKFKRINIKERIRVFYAKVLTAFKNPKHQESFKVPYSHFTGNNKEEKISCFLPMLYLSNTNRLWLEQEKHFDEIFIYIYETFKKRFPEYDQEIQESNDFPENVKAELIEEIKEEMLEIEEELDKREENEKLKRVEKLNKDFENPIGDLMDSS